MARMDGSARFKGAFRPSRMTKSLPRPFILRKGRGLSDVIFYSCALYMRIYLYSGRAEFKLYFQTANRWTMFRFIALILFSLMISTSWVAQAAPEKKTAPAMSESDKGFLTDVVPQGRTP